MRGKIGVWGKSGLDHHLKKVLAKLALVLTPNHRINYIKYYTHFKIPRNRLNCKKSKHTNCFIF